MPKAHVFISRFLAILMSLFFWVPWSFSADLPPLSDIGSQHSGFETPTVRCSHSFSHVDSLNTVLSNTNAVWKKKLNGRVTHVLPRNPIWCQFRVAFELENEAWYFGVGDPNIEDIQLYLEGDTLPTFQAGTQFPFSQRPVENRFFYFPITNSGSTEQLITIRLSSKAMNAPLQLVTLDRLKVRVANRQSLASMTFGLVIPLIAALIASRKMIQKRASSLRLWSSAIVISYIFTSTSIQGYGFQYIWQTSMQWNQIAFLISTTIGLAVLWRFLNVLNDHQFNALQKLFMALVAIAMVCALTYLLLPLNQLYLISLVSLVVSGFLLLGRQLLYLCTHRTKAADKFWAAWISSVAVSIVQAVGIWNFGVDIELITTLNFFALTALLGWELFQFIESNQRKLISVLENKVFQEQQIAHLQQVKTNELEAKVAERTQELAKMMRELHLTNVRLRTASSTDALTGIMNRYAVDTYIEETWNKCTTKKQSYSIGMIDADYFKKVNDTHGHGVGDDCLKQLASIITHSLTQTDMRVARYGGEEFVVIAPNMAPSQLYVLMEQLRANIEITPIHSDDLEFSITVSIGVSGTSQTDETSPRLLIQEADTALYFAKNNNRNQVALYEPTVNTGMVNS